LAILIGVVTWSRRPVPDTQVVEPEGVSTQVYPAQTYLNEQKIKIGDLLGDVGEVSEKAFEGCQIIGPAAIHFEGPTVLRECTFQSPLEHLFLEVKLGTRLLAEIKF
jgi:hypothetical protein